MTIPKLTADEKHARAAKQAAEQRAKLAKTETQRNAELAKAAAIVAPKTETIRVRVTEFGSGRISTGEHIAGVGEVHFETGEELTLTEEQYEAYRVGPHNDMPRGWVERA